MGSLLNLYCYCIPSFAFLCWKKVSKSTLCILQPILHMQPSLSFHHIVFFFFFFLVIAIIYNCRGIWIPIEVLGWRITKIWVNQWSPCEYNIHGKRKRKELYAFSWLCQVLFAAHKIFIVAFGVFPGNVPAGLVAPRHVGSQFPNQGSNPPPQLWECGFLTTGSPGKS